MRSATLEHCHDFRAPSSRVEKGDNYAHTVLYSEKRPKGLKKFVRCYCCLTLYNTNGHSQQTWICFSHIYNFYLQPRCADFAKNLAKIDTEMLIPEGRKLPLKVVWQKREEFWQLFQKNIKQKKRSVFLHFKGIDFTFSKLTPINFWKLFVPSFPVKNLSRQNQDIFKHFLSKSDQK